LWLHSITDAIFHFVARERTGTIEVNTDILSIYIAVFAAAIK